MTASVFFIQAHRDGPFFLYLPHTMVHVPLAVSEAFQNRTGKLIWDASEEVDWSVGEILNAVAEAGIDERTMFIFTSDNGAAVGSSLRPQVDRYPRRDYRPGWKL